MPIFARKPKTTAKGRRKQERRAFNRKMRNDGKRYRGVIKKRWNA
jgi:hypothetical protein